MIAKFKRAAEPCCRGEPCGRGQTAARSGCTPKARGVSRDKAAGFKRALAKAGSRKGWVDMEQDVDQREGAARHREADLSQQLGEVEAKIAGVQSDKPRRPATGPLASRRISDDTLRSIAQHEGLDHRAPDWFENLDPKVIQEARMGAIKGKGSSSLSTLLRQRAALVREQKRAQKELEGVGAEREKRLGVPFSRFAAARESVRGAKGQPCRQGQTAARTGCTPKAKGQAVDREKAARFKTALAAAKKRAHAAEARAKELETELGGPSAATEPKPAATTHQDAKPGEHWGSKDQPFWRPGPNPTVDMVLTRKGEDGQDEVLLIQRATGTAEGGKWALPGGFVDTSAPKGQPHASGQAEKPEDAALRELQEETGLDASTLGARLREVGKFDKRGRDPRDNDEAWATSTAFHLDVSDLADSGKVQGLDDAMKAQWVPVKGLGGMDLAFDHGDILSKAGVGAKSAAAPKGLRERIRKPKKAKKAPAGKPAQPDLGARIVDEVTQAASQRGPSPTGWDRVEGGIAIADLADRMGAADMPALRQAVLSATRGEDAPLRLTRWSGNVSEIADLPHPESIISVSRKDGRMLEGYAALDANLRRSQSDPERLEDIVIYAGVAPRRAGFAANGLRAYFARRA